jgi:uncharacterized OB-fold protein
MNQMQKTNPSLFYVEGEAPGAPGLKGSRCPGCGQVVLLQVAACPRCGRRDLAPVCIGQRATLGESAEVFHPADGFEAPYVIGMIETEQGPRTFAPIAVPAGTPLRVGLRLRFRLLPRADGRVGFAYEPAEAPGEAG